jgi:hypothetical protein
LSLGNFYYSSAIAAKSEQASGKESSQSKGSSKEPVASSSNLIKDSYKFFHHVLHQDISNAYAANGLGIIFIEKNEIDAAKETFAKVLSIPCFPFCIPR